MHLLVPFAAVTAEDLDEYADRLDGDADVAEVAEVAEQGAVEHLLEAEHDRDAEGEGLEDAEGPDVNALSVALALLTCTAGASPKKFGSV